MTIIKINEFNALACEDLILSIYSSSSVGKVTFRLVKNEKSEDYLEGNCKVAWDRMLSKNAPHTASSLVKLKSDFHKSNLESIDKDPINLFLIWKGCKFE